MTKFLNFTEICGAIREKHSPNSFLFQIKLTPSWLHMPNAPKISQHLYVNLSISQCHLHEDLTTVYR